jgi:tetratricopeptide (TPR) repeat protein
LGFVLGKLGQWDASLASYREALRINPAYARCYVNLGMAFMQRKQWPEAVTVLREAVRLQHDYPRGFEKLAFALRCTNQLDAAVAASREAIRQDPSNAALYVNLGEVLMSQGLSTPAADAYREAIDRDPRLAVAHYNLGNALTAQRQFAGAVAAYQEALRLQPKYAEAYCNLGQALKAQGEFRAALANLRKGHQLGSKVPGWRYASADWLRKCERLVELEDRLPKIVAGQAAPAGALEELEMAELCTLKRRHGDAVDFYERAFAGKPDLEIGSSSSYRFKAACAATLAACSQGDASNSANKRTPAYFRQKALGWLNRELAALIAQEQRVEPAARGALQKSLDRWLREPALEAVRGTAAVARLPVEEQVHWRQLWEKVNQQGKEARAVDGR